MSHIFGPADGDQVYCNVAAGDFNGDGFDDILWGHPGSPSPDWFGKVYVILGRQTFPDLIDLESPPVGVSLIIGHDYFGFLGYGLQGGDFTGDGIDDIVVSATGMIYSEVYVITGSPCLLPVYSTGYNQPGMTRIIDVDPYRGMGTSLDLGDIDLDGKSDLLLGAPGNSFGPELDGRLYILHGSEGLSDSVLVTDMRLQTKIVMPEYPSGQLGQSVAIGDINSDGMLDIVASALSADVGGYNNCGIVYAIRSVVELADTTWLASTSHPLTRLLGSGADTWYGLGVELGNVDGDGANDIVVSNWPTQQNQRARTVIAYASALTSNTHVLASDPGFTRIIEKKIGDRLGSGLACGDLNRDGLDDLLIGAQSTDEVYLINGCYVLSAVAESPSALTIRQNYPNPFNPATTIAYTLPNRSRVRMHVFDVTGKRIATLVDSEQDPGEHVARWNGVDDKGQEAASGVYFCRLAANEFTTSVKLVLLR